MYNKYILMDYKKIYDLIISRAKYQNRIKNQGIYYEAHHILPICLGGEGTTKQHDHPNIVLLTGKEHFLCHLLLIEIYPEIDKLKQALWLMTIGKRTNRVNNYKISSKIYERLRIEASIYMSKIHKGKKYSEETKLKIGKIHKGKKRSEETKQKMRKPKSTTINMKHPKSEITKKRIGDSMRGKTWLTSEEGKINKRKACASKERNHKLSVSLSKPILQYDLQNNFIKEWKSITEANIYLSKPQNASSISRCVRGLQKQAFGYVWKFKIQ